jgi:hypothetical protein
MGIYRLAQLRGNNLGRFDLEVVATQPHQVRGPGLRPVLGMRVSCT